jgi:hypothetical protein
VDLHPAEAMGKTLGETLVFQHLGHEIFKIEITAELEVVYG